MLCLILIVSYLLAALPALQAEDLEASRRDDRQPPGTPTISDLELKLREETLSLREEMYSMMGSDSRNTLSWVVRDLVQEVRGYKQLVSEQSTKHAEELGEIKTELKLALEKLDGLKSTVDVMRSEVRLISQQKLTWQNSTGWGRHFADFLVDGVYRMAYDESGMNPIQHTDDDQVGPNMMVMIDLGALFKIHTVKLWKRTSTCCDNRFPGLLIYADDTLLGVTSGVKYLYDIPVRGEVYANKIYVKQPARMTMNFLEIQVWGTGPFGEDEVDC